jgi:FlaA1/EpsC-like NDP-sugar epimerase
MIIGATGSIGSVCSRLLAQAIKNVVLVSIEPEKLIELKRTIQEETPGAEGHHCHQSAGDLGDCDLIVTATSALGSACRHHQVQAGRGHLRRGPPAGHQPKRRRRCAPTCW